MIKKKKDQLMDDLLICEKYDNISTEKIKKLVIDRWLRIYWWFLLYNPYVLFFLSYYFYFSKIFSKVVVFKKIDGKSKEKKIERKSKRKEKVKENNKK